MNQNNTANGEGRDGRLPKYDWPRPGDDCPRLSWPDWLSAAATALEADHPADEAWGWVAAQLRERADESRMHGLDTPQEHATWLAECDAWENDPRWLDGTTWTAGPAAPQTPESRDDASRAPEGERDHLWN